MMQYILEGSNRYDSSNAIGNSLVSFSEAILMLANKFADCYRRLKPANHISPENGKFSHTLAG
jgi:hypothetical protein